MNMVAYVDGSFMNNMYGSGYVLFDEAQPDKTFTSGFAGKEKAYTQFRNVAGELLAVMGVVEGLRPCQADVDSLTIYYDYEGVEKWVTREWKATKKLTVLYRDYMLCAPFPVKFVKVKAHSGNKYNEMADQLAKEAILNARNL